MAEISNSVRLDEKRLLRRGRMNSRDGIISGVARGVTGKFVLPGAIAAGTLSALRALRGGGGSPLTAATLLAAEQMRRVPIAPLAARDDRIVQRARCALRLVAVGKAVADAL
jgi:hypothetical protein